MHDWTKLVKLTQIAPPFFVRSSLTSKLSSAVGGSPIV